MKYYKIEGYVLDYYYALSDKDEMSFQILKIKDGSGILEYCIHATFSEIILRQPGKIDISKDEFLTELGLALSSYQKLINKYKND